MIDCDIYLPLPIKKTVLKRALRGAMLKYSPEEYSVFVYISLIFGVIAGYIINMFNINALSNIKNIIPVFLGAVFYSFALIYPFALSRSRRVNIDIKLPHAVTYMRSLCNTMTLYNVFRQIYLEKDLYGEVSEEFGFVVRDVELFGMSFLEAIQDLAASTPSELLREFLYGLVIVSESGGDIRGYMDAKVESFRDKARKQLEINMKTLEILAEVFAVLFVALPVFLIILVATAHFLGRGVGKVFYSYLYFFMPVGGLMLIYVVDLINIKEDLSVTRVRRIEPLHFGEFAGGQAGVADQASVTDEERPGVKEILLKPFRLSKENYYYSLVFSPLLLLVWVVLVRYVKFKFVESKVAALIVLLLLPLAVAFEYRSAFVRRVEKETPDLLRQILNLRDVGLTLHGVISMLKESKLGVLSREIRLTSINLEWGATVNEALIELINRVGVSSIRRAITLLLRASEVTENIRDVLITAIEDFEYELKLKDIRFATGFAYLVIIYLAFFILLYVCYTMIHSFLARLPNYTPSMGLLSMMYQIAFVLSIFSGTLAGQMEKGHALHGLKHIFVFLIASAVMFEVVIPGISVYGLIR